VSNWPWQQVYNECVFFLAFGVRASQIMADTLLDDDADGDTGGVMSFEEDG